MPSFYFTILLLHVAGSFNEKGNIPFVIKIEKREEEKKTFTNAYKVFRKHTFVLTRAQLSLSWLQSQKCRHAVVMCFRFGAMQHYVDNLLLLALKSRIG